MNPVLVVREYLDDHGSVEDRSCYVWCPGCVKVHPFRVFTTGNQPVWSWDGNKDAPTFSPSLLCYTSVHLCADEHLIPCPGGDCGHTAHRLLDDGALATHGPHTADPAYGNCHSFLTAGVWQFLGDCAHRLAGQSVPLQPLPDWWIR